MRFWQLRRLARLLNGKPPRPIAPLQILETIDRDTRGARRELEEAGLLLRIPATDALLIVSLHSQSGNMPTYLPKVLDDLVVLGVPAVISVLLPVIDVNIRNTANQELEFALVEHVDQVGGDELVEARNEGVELLFDALLDAPFRDETARRNQLADRTLRDEKIDLLDVFLLILVRDLNVLAARLELDADRLAEPLVVCAKGEFERVGDVIVPAATLAESLSQRADHTNSIHSKLR